MNKFLREFAGENPADNAQNHACKNIAGEVDIEIQPGEGDETGQKQRRDAKPTGVRHKGAGGGKRRYRVAGGEGKAGFSEGGGQQIGGWCQPERSGAFHQRLDDEVAEQIGGKKCDKQRDAGSACPAAQHQQQGYQQPDSAKIAQM